MPKIIFQPLMISNPPGCLVALKSAWNASFCKGLHKMKVTNFRFMHCVSSWDAIGSYITMFYLTVVNNKPI